MTTVDSPLDLKIPAGTQPGTMLVMGKKAQTHVQRFIPPQGIQNMRILYALLHSP